MPNLSLYCKARWGHRSRSQFVHASETKGVTISKIDAPYRGKYYWTTRRIIPVAKNQWSLNINADVRRLSLYFMINRTPKIRTQNPNNRENSNGRITAPSKPKWSSSAAVKNWAANWFFPV